jgi:hypothetical protein
MFGSNVLDIAIGLAFVFLVLSLICSAANELVEMYFRNRAKDLERGIRELLGVPQSQDELKKTEDFLKALYDHGLINNLYQGNYKPGDPSNLPSYIPSRNFALAFMSIAKVASPLAEADASLPTNVITTLNTLRWFTDTEPDKLQASIEDWYNSSMDRVAGWYKRRSQIIIVVIGFVVAVGLNADCISIAQRLSRDSSLRQAVVAMAEQTAKTAPSSTDATKSIETNINALSGLSLPIGWPADMYDHMSFAAVGDAIVQHIGGWILTATAVSLGAPFWFDMLNKIIVVRSTVKPSEKSKEEPSKDAAA